MSNYRSAVERRTLSELLKRDHTLLGGVVFGLDGHIIELQARAVSVLNGPTPWRIATRITGMAAGTVRESLDRISGAFSKLQIPDPEVGIIVNLAPADLPKFGTWLDLPIAIIMLQAAGNLPDISPTVESELILVGELGLHGEIRRVPGSLSMAFAAKAGQTLIVPTANERECAMITANPDHKGCRVASVSMLDEVIDFFCGKRKLDNVLGKELEFEPVIAKGTDFASVLGQDRAKEAALICAAGGHNLLMIGPPGEGKSLLAGALPTILPPLTTAEKVELTRIYSASGRLERDGMAVTRRPMRPVHHTATRQSLVGGGSGVPQPGEVTLAHFGVLFLDELPEFPRSNIESLRQPLESGEITVTRVGASLTFPARFTLVAAMNPCPCGYHGTDKCRCKPTEIKKYLSKISGPIVDRIDLQVELSRLSTDERFSGATGETSAQLRERVLKAREWQASRFAGSSISHNAAIPGGQVRGLCNFSEEGFSHYKRTLEQSTLSTRAIDKLAKVSRTIADLEGSPCVEPRHVDRASLFVVGGLLRDSF
jgi:magnesium chelatase family protein